MLRHIKKRFDVCGIPMEATRETEATWVVRVLRTGTPIAVVRRSDHHGAAAGRRTYITDNHPSKPFHTIEDTVAHMALEWRRGH